MKTPVVSFLHGPSSKHTSSHRSGHNITNLTRSSLALAVGGGLGLACHAPFRVATETTKLSMPETVSCALKSEPDALVTLSFGLRLTHQLITSQKIGLFPDVGASVSATLTPHPTMHTR